MRPTLLPSLANATAKFTAIVDFPTPPLPEAIAINSTGLFCDNNPSIVLGFSFSFPVYFSTTSAGSSSKRMPTVFAPFSFKALTTDICKSSCGCPPN